MKLTSFAVIFSVVVIPIIILQDMRIDNLEEEFYNRKYIKTVLENASEDAAITLKESSSIYSYNSDILSYIDEEKVFDEFIKSLSRSFGVVSENEMQRFNRYVPLMIVLTDKGYYISTIDEIKTKNGTFLKRLTSPMKMYSYERNGIYYFFSLSGDITVLYRDVNNELVEVSGSREELLNDDYITVDLDFIVDIDVKKIIVQRINEDISSSIKAYNNIMKKYGKKFDLSFTDMQDRLNMATDSPSLISVFSGYEESVRGGINVINVSRLKITRNDLYTGFEKEGVKYYVKNSIFKSLSYDAEKLFTSEIEAVKSGYYLYKN